MTPDQLKAELGANLARLPGSNAVRAEREAAFAGFAQTGFPSRRLEDWRYTNIAAIADADFLLFPQAAPVADRVIDELLREAGVAPDAAALVFVDGELAADRAQSWRTSAEVELLTLAASLERHGPALRANELSGWPLAALNLAFARHGVHLRIARGAQASTPLHIVCASLSAEAQAAQPQLVLELARRASARVILHLLASPESRSWTNLLTAVRLDEGARLALDRAQTCAASALHTELVYAAIGQDASLRSTSLDLGGRLVRNDLSVRLEAPGASCDLAGLSTAATGQHLDNHVWVEHLAAHTQSLQRYRAIVGDRGRCVFAGKVVVHAGTRGISAMQSSDNLLLAKSGEIDTKPELEINADDVKCSHGATIGELDESQLFYLRARGIDEPMARGLLTIAFAEQILERVPEISSSSVVAEKFGLALPGDAGWSPLA